MKLENTFVNAFVDFNTNAKNSLKHGSWKGMCNGLKEWKNIIENSYSIQDPNNFFISERYNASISLLKLDRKCNKVKDRILESCENCTSYNVYTFQKSPKGLCVCKKL